MDFDSVTFFLDDAYRWTQWFVNALGFGSRSQTLLQSQDVCIYIADPSPTSEAARAVTQYLSHHPPGVGNIGFRVRDVDAAYERAIAAGAAPIQSPIQCQTAFGMVKQATVSGWGDLCHTLVEYRAPTYPSPTRPLPEAKLSARRPSSRELTFPPTAAGRSPTAAFTTIDHAVLNVPAGDMEKAATWYSAAFGFECEQTFSIRTPRSALRSMVMTHPSGTATVPINEPATAHSQIQEFLDVNRGSGIQHVALATDDIVQTLAQLRQNGVRFLSVPPTYYEQLPTRPGFRDASTNPEGDPRLDWGAIARQEVLVDWRADTPEAPLLQAFTQPIFGEPTFFFEVIQRQRYRRGDRYRQAEGFGEGNFQALFEAMEREQMKRGSLPTPR